MPQNWLFLAGYKKQREKLLKTTTWNLLVRLGSGAFETIGGEVVNVILMTHTRKHPAPDFMLRGIDVSTSRPVQQKAKKLITEPLLSVSQSNQLRNPDSRVALTDIQSESLLADVGDFGKGSTTGDSPRFLIEFWQIARLQLSNVPWVDSPTPGAPWSGRSLVTTVRLDDPNLNAQLGCWLRGNAVWGKRGVAVNKMKELEPFLYSGEVFDDNVCPIVPADASLIPAIWAFVSDPCYREAVREVDRALKVTAGTLTKVPFDPAYWRQVATEKYPIGLPEPYSDDPTQWIFHGHPEPSTDPLQVAVARLVGYTWPAESDGKMELSDEGRAWIARSKALASHADKDGIVCIPPLGRESSASDRLLNLLADAYGADWSNDVLARLLTAADHAGKSLETWLRDKFFSQHCALFGRRPFIWHVWDGLRDGFAALVNYHRLDYKALESLIYTYLGDWIGRQKRDADNGIDGAQEKLAAAEALKKRLEVILAGEEPYDIFVRWKPIEEQPIGWNPDLNDGVRLNIRPFLSVPDVGKRGAGVLRDKPKSLHWDKDRGSDVPSAPWYELGLEYGGKVGDRINDHHLTLDEKRAAREKAK